MRTRRWIGLIWLCGLARLVFYAAMLPLWEGYDEWSHFAVISIMADRGEALVSRDAPIPPDVEASLASLPMPWTMRDLSPHVTTHDVYWTDHAPPPPAPLGLKAYEGLQPPLYYWLMIPFLRGGVLAVRLASVLMASLTVPLVFFVARAVSAHDAIATGCAAVVAVMPGFALDVARVGNDSLAVPLFTLLIWLALRKPGALAGVVLGLGLLTKVYFLVGALALVLLWRRRALLPAGIALLISGWWYVRNVLTTGTVAGLSESVMLRDRSPLDMLRGAANVSWPQAIDSILFSHIYFGGWSSLTVRSWIYHLFYAVILLALIGLWWVRRPMKDLLLVYSVFWLGQLYNVVLLFLSKGASTSMGWYLYAAIAAEVILCVAGLRRFFRAWAAAAGVFLFALLDLYTVHVVAIPYYAGMIRHKPNGALAAFHPADWIGLGETLRRLAAHKLPPSLLFVLWACYLAATLALCLAAVRFARAEQRNSNSAAGFASY